MKLVSSLFGVLVLVTALVADDTKGVQLSFASAKVGEVPKGWSVAKTGNGSGSVWKIVEDKDAPGGKALAQTSAAGSGSFFNVCIADAPLCKDFDATFSFKASAGKEDQGGGLIWRCKDADNYYIARFNPLEDNFRFYKVQNGRRSAPIGNAKASAPAGQWHTMRIVCHGDHMQCYLNGKMHIDAKDSTFKDAGKLGFWTKADAQTSFADLTVAEK